MLGASESIEDVRPRMRRAPLAIGIFVGVLALVTAGVLTLPLAVMLGVLIAFISRCITPEEAYARVEWKAIILIGSLLGLGAAMEHTGAAKYLAWQLVSFTGTTQPLLLLTIFFAHCLSHAADVKPGGRDRGFADCHRDCAPPGDQSAHLRDDGRDCRKLFLSHAAGAGMSHGLRTGTLSLCGFHEDRISADAADLRRLDHAGASRLAAEVISGNGRANCPRMVVGPEAAACERKRKAAEILRCS